MISKYDKSSGDKVNQVTIIKEQVCDECEKNHERLWSAIFALLFIVVMHSFPELLQYFDIGNW